MLVRLMYVIFLVRLLGAMKKNKVCIIGAGTAGLCGARHSIQAGMDVTVYEQASDVGGTWVYTDKIGMNEYGLKVHTSMYKGLKTNLPKEIMGYPDFPIPAQENSYIPSEDMLDFLNQYANHYRLQEKIKFLHHVIRIAPIDGDQWEIIVKDLKSDKIEKNLFDAVMVCNGHYNTPAYPNYPGHELFKGKQIHSHDYRCSAPFKDEDVLVIGAGPSGIDLANEISKVARRVTLSHHLPEPPKTKFQSNVDQKSDVVRIGPHDVEFGDGTRNTYTTIFYCTGYKYTFPFLSVDCGIATDDNYIRPLYKHCININYPSMAFIGLPFYVCASQMFDLQVRFCVRFLSGQKSLPAKSEMLRDTETEMAERWQRGYKKRQAHMMGPDQGKYYDDLAHTADIEPLKPVMTKLHNDSSQRFLDDLINFRNDRYRILDDETFIKYSGK